MVNQGLELDRAFRALANPVRRGIVSSLCNGGMTLGEIAKPLSMSLPAVSRHVRLLEEAGLVVRHRHGRQHYLSVSRESLHRVGRWLDERTAHLADAMDRLEAHLKRMEGK
jgi:DNA-binding transcriptional ArsR family regulator